MKRFSQCVCLLLVIVIFLTTSAFAAEEVMPRASSFFGGSSVYLWKTSDTTFQVWFDVKALSSMEELGASVIKVQRSADGENWLTMRTYTKENYPNMICKNTVTHVDCVSYNTATQGYYYRAYIVLYAKNSTGTGLLNRYTASIKL